MLLFCMCHLSLIKINQKKEKINDCYFSKSNIAIVLENCQKGSKIKIIAETKNFNTIKILYCNSSNKTLIEKNKTFH